MAVAGRFDALQLAHAGDVREAQLDVETAGNFDRLHEWNPPKRKQMLPGLRVTRPISKGRIPNRLKKKLVVWIRAYIYVN